MLMMPAEWGAQMMAAIWTLLRSLYLFFLLTGYMVLGLLCAYGLLAAAAIVITGWQGGQCFELPNGLLVGREAFFDPREYLWKPRVTLKLPDGTVPVKDRIGRFSFSQTTAVGVAELQGIAALDYGFAYRPDVGLVVSYENRALYEKLQDEGGPWISLGRSPRYKGRYAHTDLWTTYIKMREDRSYIEKPCPSSIFPQ